jgi:hypothetical protein
MAILDPAVALLKKVLMKAIKELTIMNGTKYIRCGSESSTCSYYIVRCPDFHSGILHGPTETVLMR